MLKTMMVGIMRPNKSSDVGGKKASHE